jgi:hypothetical protein
MLADDEGKIPFLEAQSKLDEQFSYEYGLHKFMGIFKFNDDRNRTIPIRFMTGEMGLGDAFAMKFIRGIAFYGTGHLQVRVYIDKAPVKINRPIGDPLFGTNVTYADVELVETPDPQRVLWLPRGTKGRTVNIEASGNIKHIRSIIVFWDPLTGEEDG